MATAYPQRVPSKARFATPAQVQLLEQIIRKELHLLERYKNVITEESGYITKFNTDAITRITAEKRELLSALGSCQEQRLQYMRQFPEGDALNLRQLVKQQFTPTDIRRVLPLAKELRLRVEDVQRSGRQHNQLLQFSLRMVHGLLSILRSASLNVVQSYTRKGSLHESYHPSQSNRRNSNRRA